MDDRILKLNFKDTLSALSDLMMPRVCLVCGRELTLREKHLCLPCSLDLPLTRFEFWEHNPMANKYNERISSSNAPLVNQIHEKDNFVHKKPFWCTKSPSEMVSYIKGASGVRNLEDLYEPYQRATALLHYWHESGYANIPQALKYGRDLEAGRYFGSMLGKRLRSSPLFADVDLVVPVPLHWTRHLRRGYNQAEILARAIARELSAPGPESDTACPGSNCPESDPACPGIPGPAHRDGDSLSGFALREVALAPRLLRRVRRTSTQTRKTLEEKTRNVSGAFAVRKSAVKKILKETRPNNPPQNELTVRRVHTLSDSGEGMCKKGSKCTYPRSFTGGYAQREKEDGQSSGDNQGKNINVAARGIHHILLVDDVFTTGSTLTECHNALRKVFGPDVRISLATLSFAG